MPTRGEAELVRPRSLVSAPQSRSIARVDASMRKTVFSGSDVTWVARPGFRPYFPSRVSSKLLKWNTSRRQALMDSDHSGAW